MIQKLIQKIPLDKLHHVILGILIGFPLVLFLGNLGGIISLFLVGIGKEVIHDWLQKKGNPEWCDFWASAIPILMFMILLNISYIASLIKNIF